MIILALATAFISLAQITSAEAQLPDSADQNRSPEGPSFRPFPDNRSLTPKQPSDFKNPRLRGALDGVFKSTITQTDMLQSDRPPTGSSPTEAEPQTLGQLFRILTKSHADLEEAYTRQQALRQARLENDGAANVLAGMLSLVILAAYVVTAWRQPESCAEYRVLWHVLTGILLAVYVWLIANPDAPYCWLGYLVPLNVGVIGPLSMKFIGWWISTEPVDDGETQPFAED